MRVVSVNVGRPRTVDHQGRQVRTAIYKTPVTGAVRVGRLNLDGDAQADLRVHGGEDKAAYVYPSEHYAYWARELKRDLPWGQFGENLTVEGLLEDDVCIGDVLRIGDARFEVTQPRTPCYKLAMKMEIDDFIARFAASLRTGFYLRVLDEGSVAAGVAITREMRGQGELSVREAFRLRFGEPVAAEALQRAVEVPALTGGWRRAYQQRLAMLAATGPTSRA